MPLSGAKGNYTGAASPGQPFSTRKFYFFLISGRYRRKALIPLFICSG
jgi:hypothetical protein